MYTKGKTIHHPTLIAARCGSVSLPVTAAPNRTDTSSGAGRSEGAVRAAVLPAWASLSLWGVGTL